MQASETKTSDIKISASILAANPLCFQEEVTKVIQSGADRLHIDIMDGHYVPNLTFGPHCIHAIKKISSVPLDVHLMVKNTDVFIEMYKDASDTIIIHPECTDHLHRSLMRIKDLGKKAGVALNPATPLEFLWPVLECVDHVLVMSVNPGFGGQSFIEASLKKLEAIQNVLLRKGSKAELSVDGGINAHTAAAVKNAGATVLVAGSAIFNHADYAKAIDALRNA